MNMKIKNRYVIRMRRGKMIPMIDAEEKRGEEFLSI